MLMMTIKWSYIQRISHIVGQAMMVENIWVLKSGSTILRVVNLLFKS